MSNGGYALSWYQREDTYIMSSQKTLLTQIYETVKDRRYQLFSPGEVKINPFRLSPFRLVAGDQLFQHSHSDSVFAMFTFWVFFAL